MHEFGEMIGLVGVGLGWGLGYLTQLSLARRQEARQLDQTRRNLYTQFLTAARNALNHLAEGAMNRINGAIPKGAYATRFFDDHEKLQAAISGMELISTAEVLTPARKFGEAQWVFAGSEANAEPVDRSKIDEATFKQLGADILKKLNELGSMHNEFITAARDELRIPPLGKNRM